jgi:hypothetical protein
MKEMKIPHSEISNPQTITQRNVQEFRKHGLDIHRHEVKELHDDHRAGVRTIKVDDRKYFSGSGKRS